MDKKLNSPSPVFHLIVGLPGSGKSCLARSIMETPRRTVPAILIDDGVIPDSIPKGWKDDIIVADARLCCPVYRGYVLDSVSEKLPFHQLKWTWFDNEPDVCFANLIHRGATQAVIRDLKLLSQLYAVPTNSEVMPVWRPDNSEYRSLHRSPIPTKIEG